MRLSNLVALPAALISTALAASAIDSPEYHEHLRLRPLPGASLYAGFQFNGTTTLQAYKAQHFRFFPRSLAQILQHTHTAELHLRFSLGRWDEETWGSRPRSGSREGGNGVELWAWLEADENGEVEARWSDLVNSLSGLFCASLNFIDSGKTTRPVLSFDSEGTLDQWQKAEYELTDTPSGQLTLLHGMLPHEVVCTENLTPFLKLLPCKGQAGIGSLLDGHKLFDSSWQAMSIDISPRCTADECRLDIQQTVDMVLNIPRSMRPLNDPIPRPRPIEEIPCDESKYYNSEDTCFPKPADAEMVWSLQQLFGHPITASCPLSPSDWHDVSVETFAQRIVEVTPSLVEKSVLPLSDGAVIHSYRIAENRNFDITLHEHPTNPYAVSQEPPLYASRQITGYGAERGGMHTTLTNPRPYPQRIVYLESLPWFLRPYIHTIRTDGGRVVQMYYTPLLDRKRGTHLELLIEVPAHSTVTITYDFEKAILRYTEYPPDANRGFDIPPAIIRVKNDAQPEGAQADYYLRTTSLLLPLPTPDFSMPYNVIILTSTVIALGFGSIFNLLVRRFVLAEEVPPALLAVVVRSAIARVRARFQKPAPVEKKAAVMKEPQTDLQFDQARRAKQSNGKIAERGKQQ